MFLNVISSLDSNIFSCFRDFTEVFFFGKLHCTLGIYFPHKLQTSKHARENPLFLQTILLPALLEFWVGFVIVVLVFVHYPVQFIFFFRWRIPLLT